ncbi:Uncharacterized protein conserved in bacteria [Leclercia adecarboxylata]|uniref:Uncharacterized protein conserved in bacteria n=1 Tax=Leclercia adecarboxylata TaxID=83655 RepID=A0A4U9HWG7_9ENTR|nr:Uncharacterized protein conserved in bacteria [Leclercia adecarboxylata]
MDAGQKLRGEGFELRTDFVGSYPWWKGCSYQWWMCSQNAQGATLDMAAAVAQLQSALELVTALAQSVAVSGALNADRSSQHQLKPGSEPVKRGGDSGISTSRNCINNAQKYQLSSGHTLTATAGENIDMSIFKRLTVAAGEAISLFAQKMGVKLFAARGIVDIQAQTDAIRYSV